ncbi:MAG: DUF1549 and DUF1553 domain-containing protein [Gemmataceae bacterium]
MRGCWLLGACLIGLATAGFAAEPAARTPSLPLFQPPRRAPLPAVRHAAWPVNPIDRFVLARLEAKDLVPTRPASRLTLLRRVTFDLTGLPPTVAEQDAFVSDSSPDAYRRVVDRLLASPRFGERWAQHWLDLARYAETDGFNQDAHRPNAHRYRDWVIAALNANLPYDRFVQHQLAGDELAPGDPAALTATGFNRLWPDEWNAANLEQRRQEILDDTTDTAGLVFLGLTVGCARCHDHKYDPLAQKEYFRLQAFFAAMQPRDLPALPADELRRHRERTQAWEKATASLRAEIDSLVGKKQAEARAYTLTKFRDEIQQTVRIPAAKRTPYQQQIALTATKQLDLAAAAVPAKLPPAQKKRYDDLQRELLAAAPPAPPLAMATVDVGPVPPPTHRLIGGDWRKPAAEVRPGFPEALGEGEVDTRLPAGVVSTGRRAALARWLTRPDHPLTARVMVNRLWQHHFGVGIVATSNDFGVQGTPPTHPELLDWLAVELVESGWDLKHLHRLMVTSAAYGQDSVVDPANPAHARALTLDRDNGLLWHARRRRLEGEAIRDALLAIAGELNGRLFGPSARPELPAAVGNLGWKPDADAAERNRRSIYVLVKRNLRYPLFDAFDLPDLHNSCSRRLSTTTAPQALILLNSELTLGRARRWAETLHAAHGEDVERMTVAACRAAWGRPATTAERTLAARFLDRQTAVYRAENAAEPSRRAFVDLCHALLNTNEFVTLD